MKIKQIHLLSLLFLQLGCTSGSKVNEYDINLELNKKIKMAVYSNQNVKLEICKTTPFKWDKIIILPPYSNVKNLRKHNLSNSKSIEQQLPELTLDENRCVLLYIDNNYIVRYSFVERQPLDFNYINNTDTIKTLSKKIGCEQLYILKKDDHSLSLRY